MCVFNKIYLTEADVIVTAQVVNPTFFLCESGCGEGSHAFVVYVFVCMCACVAVEGEKTEGRGMLGGGSSAEC